MRRTVFGVSTAALVLSLCALTVHAGGNVIDLDGIKSAVPEGWKVEQPSSNLRLYQVRIPKAEGDPKDAELVVFFFGKGSGGSVDANLKRWKDQFEAPEGKDIDDVAKVEKFKVGDAEVTKLDITGTFLEKFPPFAPNAKVTPRENYRRFGVVFANENGPFFITATGPARTMGANAEKFDRMLKSFK